MLLLSSLILAAALPTAGAAERTPCRRTVERVRQLRDGRLEQKVPPAVRRSGRSSLRPSPLAASRLRLAAGRLPGGFASLLPSNFRAQRMRTSTIAKTARPAGPRRLSPLLRQMITASRQDRPLPASMLGSQSLDLLRGNDLRVELLLNPSDAKGIDEDLARLGGETILAAGIRRTAWIPYENLPVLETLSSVRAARLAVRPRRSRAPRLLAAGTSTLAAGSTVSEGVALSGADLWQQFDSSEFGVERELPISVAVVDAGFYGYQEMLGNELPAAVTTRDFAPQWDIEGCAINDPLAPCFATGTALAEIVTDMNPNVDLYLVAVDPDDVDSFQSAIDYLASEEQPLVDIVVGGFIWSPGLSGDGFGHGPFSQRIQQLTDRGVMWVNDTGDLDFLGFLLFQNETPPAARDHWTGPFVDQVDHLFGGTHEVDGYMDRWMPDQDPQSGDTWFNELCLGPGDYIFLDLVWDDWVDADNDGIPEATEDYALDFWQRLAENQLILAETSSSVPGNFQGGDEGDYPWDTFDLFNNGDETVCYQMAIFAEFALGDNEFHLYWAADNLNQPGQLSASFKAPLSITAGNRMIPADTPGVTAVGSSSLDDQVEAFSPWALEGEGQLALCAPADVSTASFEEGGFVTSFAAAHVAGATSLLMAKLGFVTYPEALELLEARARDITGNAPDVQCGSGRLCMLTGRCAP